jgi:hypothetical protein
MKSPAEQDIDAPVGRARLISVKIRFQARNLANKRTYPCRTVSIPPIGGFYIATK